MTAIAATYRSRQVTTADGLRLEVLDGGDAAGSTRTTVPLLLLHGFTGAAAAWADLLPALAARRRVVALSLPGHGASAAPADPTRYAAHRAAADVVAVMDSLALPRVALLGYSMGGRVALHAALLLTAAAPERLAALVLESASPGIADPGERAARRAADDALAEDIERDGVPAFVERWERLPLWESQRTLPPASLARLRSQRLASPARGLANSLRGLGAGATQPLHHRLREIRVPTLLLCGALDTKYTAIAGEMAAALPCATLNVVPDAGHAVHLERPEEFASDVNAFLAGSHDEGGSGSSRPSTVSWCGVEGFEALGGRACGPPTDTTGWAD